MLQVDFGATVQPTGPKESAASDTVTEAAPPPRGPVYNSECTQYKVVDTRQIDPNITDCDLQHKLPLCCKSISIDISNTELHLLII